MALDSVLAPTTRPVFIKLDVEGAECAVVRGMRNFLRDSAQIIGFAMEVSQSRAMLQVRRHRLRPAGSPEAPLSVRSSLRLRRASVVQPQPISHWSDFGRPGHTGLVFDIGLAIAATSGAARRASSASCTPAASARGAAAGTATQSARGCTSLAATTGATREPLRLAMSCGCRAMQPRLVQCHPPTPPAHM
jgi:hypothetical protein